MGTILAMAWRNLWRHWRRSLLTALAMALGMALCTAILTLYAGMFGMFRDVLIDRQIGHVQVQHPGYVARRGMYDTVPDAADLMEQLDALPESQGAVARMYGQSLLGTEQRTSAVRLVGVQPEREARVTQLPEIVSDRLQGVESGRFLADAPAHEIVLGHRLAEDLEVGLGDEVVAVTQDALGGIGNDLYTVVGIARSGDTTMDRSGAWLHVGDLQALLYLSDQVHEIRVNGSSDDAEVVTALQAAVQDVTADVQVQLDQEPSALATRPWWEVNPAAAELFDMQGVAQYVVLIIIFSLAALGVVNTMLMSVLERTRELGVMTALGLTPLGIVSLVLTEAVLLGVLGVGLGLVLGAAADAWIIFVGVDMGTGSNEGFAVMGATLDPVIHGRFTLGSLLQPTLGALFFSLLAALWPSIRAARMKPVDAMRQGA